ncbi:MAG: hypothetical protein ACK4IX_17185 [Candidatus Sericytochromatia bacterium]
MFSYESFDSSIKKINNIIIFLESRGNKTESTNLNNNENSLKNNDLSLTDFSLNEQENSLKNNNDSLIDLDTELDISKVQSNIDDINAINVNDIDEQLYKEMLLSKIDYIVTLIQILHRKLINDLEKKYMLRFLQKELSKIVTAMNSETNINNVDEYLDAIIQKLEAFIVDQITKKSNSTD